MAESTAAPAFTSENWETVSIGGWPNVIAGPDVRIGIGGYSIAEMRADRSKAQKIADVAQAISAVPDMYAALTAMVNDEAFADLCQGIGEETQWLCDARAALAKASPRTEAAE